MESSSGVLSPRCASIISSYLEVEEVSHDDEVTSFLVIRSKRGSLTSSLEELYNRLLEENCYMRAVRTRIGVVLQVASTPKKRSKIPLHAVLAAATLATVYISGLAFAREGTGLAWSPWGYLLGLLLPLIIHESGHYIAMKKYHVPRSLPYLLPAPPLQLGFIGTFGAVINMRWLPSRNRHLAIIGIAGPIAGFIAAIPVAYYGIMHSVIRPATGLASLPLTPLIMMLFPAPGNPGPGEAIVLSPMAFSAYIVFFVTFLNLIPVAMLDGGHIVRSLLGSRGHAFVSQLVIVLLLIASTMVPGLLVFTLLVLGLYMLSRGVHPGPAISEIGVDATTALIAVVYTVLLVLTLPVPS
ncbi:MAG: site-2 protease family protein [Desulfurococcales archaeon]|nr:site-2 protease family protein [Desulfurococcales archaeon]